MKNRRKAALINKRPLGAFKAAAELGTMNGADVGSMNGADVGSRVVGSKVGSRMEGAGVTVGKDVGDDEGDVVGKPPVGMLVGLSVGGRVPRASHVAPSNWVHSGTFASNCTVVSKRAPKAHSPPLLESP